MGQVTQSQAQIDIAKPIMQYLRAAEAQVKQNEAQVAQAQAQLDQAESQPVIYRNARAAGWLGHDAATCSWDRICRPAQSLFELVTKDIWIVANFKESQLDHMRIGQTGRYRGRRLS